MPSMGSHRVGPNEATQQQQQQRTSQAQRRCHPHTEALSLLGGQRCFSGRGEPGHTSLGPGRLGTCRGPEILPQV